MCPSSGLCFTMVSLEFIKTVIIANKHLARELFVHKFIYMVILGTVS